MADKRRGSLSGNHVMIMLNF